MCSWLLFYISASSLKSIRIQKKEIHLGLLALLGLLISLTWVVMYGSLQMKSSDPNGIALDLLAEVISYR